MARAIPDSASHLIVSQYVHNEEFYTQREREIILLQLRDEGVYEPRNHCYG